MHDTTHGTHGTADTHGTAGRYAPPDVRLEVSGGDLWLDWSADDGTRPGERVPLGVLPVDLTDDFTARLDG